MVRSAREKETALELERRPVESEGRASDHAGEDDGADQLAETFLVRSTPVQGRRVEVGPDNGRHTYVRISFLCRSLKILLT